MHGTCFSRICPAVQIQGCSRLPVPGPHGIHSLICDRPDYFSFSLVYISICVAGAYMCVQNTGFCCRAFHGIFPAYAAGFILMVGVTFAGCKLREKGTR